MRMQKPKKAQRSSAVTSLQRLAPRARRAYSLVCSTIKSTSVCVEKYWKRVKTDVGASVMVGPTSSRNGLTDTSLSSVVHVLDGSLLHVQMCKHFVYNYRMLCLYALLLCYTILCLYITSLHYCSCLFLSLYPFPFLSPFLSPQDSLSLVLSPFLSLLDFLSPFLSLLRSHSLFPASP